MMGTLPIHVPVEAVSAWPRTAVPATVGALVACGACDQVVRDSSQP